MNTKSQYFPNVFFEGSVVAKEQAVVPVMTNALQYGTGIFGGIRGYYNEDKRFLSLFRIKDHYRRFLNSLKIIGVTLAYDAEKLVDITLDLTKRNRPRTDTYYRPFAYASSLNLSPALENDPVFGFTLYMMPLGEYLPVSKGLSVGVTTWRRVSDNAIPSRAKVSGLYMNSALAHHEVRKSGFDEAIFLSQEGHVVEGSAENLFMVRDGVLVTPSKTEDILEGITRNSVITLAKDLGIPVEERPIDRTELYVADEAFFSGTGVQVAWIAQVDNRQIGTGKRGPVTSKIQDLFFRIVKGNEKKYRDWCTIVADSK